MKESRVSSTLSSTHPQMRTPISTIIIPQYPKKCKSFLEKSPCCLADGHGSYFSRCRSNRSGLAKGSFALTDRHSADHGRKDQPTCVLVLGETVPPQRYSPLPVTDFIVVRLPSGPCVISIHASQRRRILMMKIKT